jgi:hypothetical protein
MLYTLDPQIGEKRGFFSTFAVSIGNITHHEIIPHAAPEIAYVNGPGIDDPLKKYFTLSYAQK